MLPDSVQKVSIWSDSPSSQFKNWLMVAAVPLLERKFKKAIVWNYFATSHGKGPVDGIGGALKQTVWKKVHQWKTIVTNPDSFVNAASESNISIVNVSTSDLQNSGGSRFDKSFWKFTANNWYLVKTLHAVYWWEC